MNTITFTDLDSLLSRAEPYAQYTTVEFWNDPHVSQFLLQEHLNPASDLASRNHAFLDRSAEWISMSSALVRKVPYWISDADRACIRHDSQKPEPV